MKFVAGASGTIGQLLCNVLNSLNEEFRAFGRSQPESYFDIGNNQWRSGNFDNYESLVQAMDGCDSVFLTCSPGKQMAEHEINVIKVAQELGVKNLVKVSVPNASRIGRTKLQRLHSLSEEFLQQSGLNWSILRPNAFMQNLHGDTQGFNINRKFCLPLEGAEYAFIDALDIAHVAASLITSEDPQNKVFNLTGPDLLTYMEVAEIITHISGNKYSFNNITDDEYTEIMKKAGVDTWFIDEILEWFREFRDLNVGNVTSDVEKVLGRAPNNIKHYITKNLSIFS